MTENITPVPADRTTQIKARVMDALNDGYELIYNKLDALHKRGIHDDDVIQALTELGETDLLEAYAEWAEIVLPDTLDPEETTDGVVPDPHDADSYIKLGIPKLVSFTGNALVRRLKEDLPSTYIEQTGGGTATIIVSKKPGDVCIAVGPGSYNWTNPDLSTFDTSDLYFGVWENEDGSAAVDPMWTIEELVEKIKAVHTTCNPEGVAK